MNDLDVELQSLRERGRKELEVQWRSLFKAPPPAAFTPDLMARGIAYRMQEQVLGGVDKAVRAQLRAESGAVAKNKSLRPGNRLVRRWRGTDYVVEVTADGFEHGGSSFGSLSKVATYITGTRWSGPRFFGLTK